MKDNLKGLRQFQEESKDKTRLAVNEAVTKLSKKAIPITYKTIAKEANVSESILYKNEELKKIVLRGKEEQVIRKSKKSGIEKVLSSEKKKILELEKIIDKYKEENIELKEVKAKLIGNLERVTNELVDLKSRYKIQQKSFTLRNEKK